MGRRHSYWMVNLLRPDGGPQIRMDLGGDSMIGNLADLLFGCIHSNTSFPQGRGLDCHINCLDCGREFSYDWQRMEVSSVRHPSVIDGVDGTVTEVLAKA